MSKFAIGDKVIGNANAHIYSITHPGWIGTVVDTRVEKCKELIRVKDDGSLRHWVSAECFDLYESPPKRPASSPAIKEFVLPYISIKRVIYNDPATIVFWSDGTKTVVKRQKNDKGKYVDKFDTEKGLALCIAKKALGNMSNFNNTINALMNNAFVEGKKK